MTAPTVGARSWAAEVDIDQVLAVLRARFPRAMIWHGDYTGSLWGAWRDWSGRVHMVEAATPAELGQRLEDAGVRAVRPTQPAAEVPGTGGMTAGVSPSAPARRPAPSTSTPEPAARPVRGRHELRRRPGLLRRLLDRLTWTEDWP